jgi:hypothetical protein
MYKSKPSGIKTQKKNRFKNLNLMGIKNNWSPKMQYRIQNSYHLLQNVKKELVCHFSYVSHIFYSCANTRLAAATW